MTPLSPQDYADLTRPLHRRLYQAALALCGNPELASDLTQEALVRGFVSRERFHRGAPMYPWLARILRNAFLDHVRSAPVRREVATDMLPESRHGEDPLSLLIEHEQGRLVTAAIATLPTEYAVAIILVDLQGLSYAEVSEITDAPVGTIRSRLSRGRALLRRALLARVERN